MSAFAPASSLRRRFRLSGAIAALSVLGGCASNLRGGIDTLTQAWSGGADMIPEAASLDPRHRYLRVTVEGRVGLMVLSQEVSTVHGRTELWYSADGAVLRLAGGRVVGFADGRRHWAWTSPAPPPAWAPVVQGQVQRFEQTIDLQPGYRIGLRRQRELHALAAPPRGLDVDGAGPGWQWFEERNVAAGVPPQPAWFAVDRTVDPPRPVYGQACLDVRWCLSWQAWPAARAAAP